MSVYSLLFHHFPTPVANALTGLWYVLLLGLILLCGVDFNSAIRYENF